MFQRRPGFTLLEVLLSSAIGVLLMAALYVAVDVQMRHAQAGRDIVEQSTLVRSLLTRIASDIAPHVAPAIPARSSSTASASGGTATAAPADGSTGTAATSASGAGGGTTGQTPATPAPAPSSMGAVQFNIGVQGDSSQLILSASRVPRELTRVADAASMENPPIVSDLRRITYWLAGGDIPLGLARYESKVATAEDASLAIPGDLGDETPYIVAEEVKSLTFTYFDGSQWLESWDGTAMGSDGATPQGPPMAIAIVIGVPSPAGGIGPDGFPSLKYYRHVVAIMTANGLPASTTTTTTTP